VRSAERTEHATPRARAIIYYNIVAHPNRTQNCSRKDGDSGHHRVNQRLISILLSRCDASPASRERKWRKTLRAIFSSPSSTPAYVVGNSRRSEPNTTHTLCRAGSSESSSASKNRGGGHPCVSQYSIVFSAHRGSNNRGRIDGSGRVRQECSRQRTKQFFLAGCRCRTHMRIGAGRCRR